MGWVRKTELMLPGFPDIATLRAIPRIHLELGNLPRLGMLTRTPLRWPACPFNRPCACETVCRICRRGFQERIRILNDTARGPLEICKRS